MVKAQVYGVWLCVKASSNDISALVVTVQSKITVSVFLCTSDFFTLLTAA